MIKLKSLLLATIWTSSMVDLHGQDVIKFQPVRDPGNSRAYSSHYTKYAVGSIDKVAVANLLQSAQHFDTLSIEADGHTYSFSLEAKDVRADDYRLRIQTDAGVEELPRSPNMTYTGLTWVGNHTVAITANEHFFTALINTDDGAIFIEPASLVNPAASADQFVLYNAKDLLPGQQPGICGTTDFHQHETPSDTVDGDRSMPAGCKVIRLALANDYQMFTKYGTASEVEVHNLAVVNLLNQNYIIFVHPFWHSVVEVFVDASPSYGPWAEGDNLGDLFYSFGDWAPTGFSNPHTAATLWTNRTVSEPWILGVAYSYGLCDSLPYNVCRDFTAHYGYLNLLQTHELCHVYGYGHDADAGYIMSPSLSLSTNWSLPSQAAMNYEIINENCVDFCQNPTSGRVGIGTNVPNPAAVLDIVSTDKGILIPRLTARQRNDIKDPVEGLLVYDKTSKSFWVNRGLPGFQWNELLSNTMLHTGPDSSLSMGVTGNLGLGVKYPQNKLDIAKDLRWDSGSHPSGLPVYISVANPVEGSGGLEIRDHNGIEGVGIGALGIYAGGFGDNKDLKLMGRGSTGKIIFKTNAVERMAISGAGNVNIVGNLGIGNASPTAPLQFSSTSANRKVVLMDLAGNNHQFMGFGTGSFALRYQTDGLNSDHIFYSGIDATQSRELMRVTGYGKVTIGNYTLGGSAIFEVSSTTKGVLIPRMSTAERTAISSPATGLLVFDNTTNSFWFRGTSAWVELTDGLDQEVFRNGPDKIYAGLTDSVGIGTINPEFKLDVRTGSNKEGIAHSDGTIKLATKLNTGGEFGTVTNHSLYLRANNGTNQFQLTPTGNIGINVNPTHKLDILSGPARTLSHAPAGMAMYITGALADAGNGFEIRDFNGNQGIGLGRNTVYAAGNWADVDLSIAAKGFTSGSVRIVTNNQERMRIGVTGNVGIGVSAPHAPLHFSSSTTNRKIVLSETADNPHQFYGFGRNTNELRYQTDATTSDHVFYAAANASASNELLRVKGTGNVLVTGAIETEAVTVIPDANGFTQYGFGYGSAAYYKDKMGRVHLRGLINTPPAPNGQVIVQLPAGYRPTAGTVVFMTLSNNALARVDVFSNGNVQVNFAAGSSWLSLDGLSFKVD